VRSRALFLAALLGFASCSNGSHSPGLRPLSAYSASLKAHHGFGERCEPLRSSLDLRFVPDPEPSMDTCVSLADALITFNGQPPSAFNARVDFGGWYSAGAFAGSQCRNPSLTIPSMSFGVAPGVASVSITDGESAFAVSGTDVLVRRDLELVFVDQSSAVVAIRPSLPTGLQMVSASLYFRSNGLDQIAATAIVVENLIQIAFEKPPTGPRQLHVELKFAAQVEQCVGFRACDATTTLATGFDIEFDPMTGAAVPVCSLP
jgi:hypothetical protein